MGHIWEEDKEVILSCVKCAVQAPCRAGSGTEASRDLEKKLECCGHTGTLSIKTVNEERAQIQEEEERRRNAVEQPRPPPWRLCRERKGSANKTSRDEAGEKQELSAIRFKQLTLKISEDY